MWENRYFKNLSSVQYILEVWVMFERILPLNLALSTKYTIPWVLNIRLKLVYRRLDHYV